VWVKGWTEVLLEQRVSGEEITRVPDIILKRDDVMIGAIEVFASHAVSRDKERALKALHLPWLEIRADEELWIAESPWTIASALPVHREGPAQPWRCPRHQSEHDKSLRELRRQEDEERELARHTTGLIAARVVDVFYPSGNWFRRIYEVRRHCTDGVTLSLSLVCADETLITAPVGNRGDSDSLRSPRRAIKSAFEADVQKYDARGRTDSPMKWAPEVVAARLIEHCEWDRTATNNRPLATRYPRRWQWSEKSMSWFLPGDMRPVHWNRAEDDVTFAEHPAWTRRKRIAREHEQRRSREAASHSGDIRRGTSPTEQPGDSQSSVETPAVLQAVSPSIYGQSPIPLAARLEATEFGDVVVKKTITDHLVVLELRRQEKQPARALVLVRRAVADADHVVAAVASALAEAGVEAVWLAARYDWSKRLASYPWLMLARGHGHQGFVVLDNVPISAHVFAESFASGAEEYAVDRIRIAGNAAAQRLPM
jgi:hypothetical protein